MSHTPLSHTNSRRGLAGLLRRSRPRKHARLQHRQLRCEALEDRRLLSVFTYTNDPKPDLFLKDKGTITSTISVPDSYYATDVNVTVNISHTRDEDLDVFLVAPDGTRVELFTDVGGTGDNFTGTVLDDAAPTPITSGSAPFSGTYRPEGDLTTVERKSVKGTWKLEVTDDTKKETGTLNSWSLTVTDAAGISTDYLDSNPALQGNVSTYGFGGNDVAMSENGDAMAVWVEYKGPGDTGPFMTMAAQYNALTGTWGPPAIISDPALTQIESDTLVANCQIAGDGLGNFLAVWQQATAGEGSLGRGSIWANRYVAGTGWQGPQTIETDVSPSSSWLPVVAMTYDPAALASKAVVAWGYASATNAPNDVKVNLLTDFANNWSGPSLAENLSVGIQTTSLTVAMAVNGDFLLTFKDSNNPYSLNGIPADAYFRYYQWGSSWTSPDAVLLESRPEDVASRPKMAMNAAGQAIVSWSQRTGTSGMTELWARRWTGSGTGSGWRGDDPVLLTGLPANALGTGYVAISDNGDAAIAYSQRWGQTAEFLGLYVRRFGDGQWQPSVTLADDISHLGIVNPHAPSYGIGMDSTGNVLAVWAQFDGDFNLWSAKFNHSTSTWSPAAILENAPYDVGNIAVAMNSSGVATTVWVQPDNTLYHLYASRTTVAPASAQLTTAPQSSPSSAMQSSADTATYPAQVDAVYQSLAYDALPQSTTEKKSTVKPKKLAATESLDAALAANDPWDIF